MPATMEQLGIDKLSMEDRLILVQEIWDSIAICTDPAPLTDGQKRLLDQRLAELDACPGKVMTWEQIKANAPEPR